MGELSGFDSLRACLVLVRVVFDCADRRVVGIADYVATKACIHILQSCQTPGSFALSGAAEALRCTSCRVEM